jgi:hypothetical protein
MGTSIKISFQSRESDRIGESGDLLIMVGNEFFFNHLLELHRVRSEKALTRCMNVHFTFHSYTYIRWAETPYTGLCLTSYYNKLS